MAKKNGFNKFTGTAIISGLLLMVLSVWAFFLEGGSVIHQIIAEYRSEVFGVAVGIFIIGVIGKLRGVKL